jgi:hypothetical protein
MNRGPRKSLVHDQSGQLLVMWLVFMLPMVLVCFSIYNVGVAVTEKMKVQTAADNAAYSAATWNARYMNQMAYLNRAMVANYDTIAALTGTWSFMDGLDGFLGLIRTILRVFFDIGDLITPAAKALHKANDALSNVVGGGNKNKRVGSYLENYSKVLSFAQQGLYIANQIGRGRVVQTIAWGVDPKIEYWLPSEIWGVQEIANRRDWKGSDEQKGLRLALERSLNELSNGGSFRRPLENFPIVGSLVKLIKAIPCFDITIGPEGFLGPGFNHVTGAPGKKGQVTIAEPSRIYQNDFSGLKIEFDCIFSFTLVEFGHNSDDQRNLPNALNLAFPHMVDEEGDHGADTFDGGGGSGFIKRNVDCDSASGPSAKDLNLGNQQDPKFQQLQQSQKLCGQGKSPTTSVDPLNNNEGLGPAPVKCTGPFGQPPCEIDRDAADKELKAANDARAKENPPQSPIPASVFDDDLSCYQVQQQLDDQQKALKKKLSQKFKSSGTCATVFEYGTPLKDVKVTHYIQKDSIPDGKRVEGPSVFVYLRKKAEVLPLFKGLGLKDDFNIEAYSFGRAYYTQRPNGGTSEKETAFNPFWAGRLEKAPVFFH